MAITYRAGTLAGSGSRPGDTSSGGPRAGVGGGGWGNQTDHGPFGTGYGKVADSKPE